MMRIRLAEFEQHFAPGELRKGLGLLKRKPPVLVARSHNHFGFEVDGYQVSFEKSGNDVHHLHCDCNHRLCRHIAAALLSQHGDALTLSTKTPRSEKTSPRAEAFRSVFISLEAAWKKITASPQPVSAQVALFVRRLEAAAQKNDFSADMAVLAAMSLCGRSALTDEKLSALTQRLIIRNFSGAKQTDEETMYLCLLETLKTNDRAMTGRFSSVLPVYLLHTRNMFHLEELRSVIERRHYRKFHADLFDELLVARTMLNFRAAELEEKSVRLLKTSPPEYFVARARLLFAAHRIDEAWEVLDELRRIVREKMPLSYFDLLSYLIALCEALHDNEKRTEVAEEMMLCSPYLSGSFVSSYIRALSPARRAERMRRIMQQVAGSGAEGAGDKLLVLAMESGHTDLFFQSPLKGRVRFTLLHELFTRQPALTGSQWLEFYFKRLCESLVQTEFAHPRAQMLRCASVLLGELPAKKARQYHELVMDFIWARPSLRVHAATWETYLPSRGRQLVFE